MASRDIVLSDFSGGVLEAPFAGDYSTRQFQEIVGLVPEQRGLRSQWECQKLGGITGVKSVRYLRTGFSSYVVVLKTDGTIWYRLEPDPALPAAQVSAAGVWTLLGYGYLVENDAGVTVTANPLHSFLCEVPVDRLTTSYQVGLLVNNGQPSGQALVIHESTTSGVLTARVYQGSRRWPQFVVKDELGNTVSTGGVEWGAEGYMPPAQVGAMWGDVLCLGRTRWYRTMDAAAAYKTNQLDSTKDKAYATGLWTSYVSPKGRALPDAFHPYYSMNLGFASPEVAIGALVPTDQGMLVFTTRGTQRDGVVLLRGRPYDYVPVLLRGSIGVPLRPSTDGDRPGAAVEWPEAGGVAFMEHSGQVWFTDSQTADRADRVGPMVPAGATSADHVAALRGTLFVARGGELWALTLLDRSAGEGFAAWTQLVVPGGGTVASMASAPECLYFVVGGEVFRFTTRGAARGFINGQAVLSRVSSPVLGDDGAPRRIRWARAGVEAYGSGSIVSVSSQPGGLFDGASAGGPVLTTPVGRSLSDGTVSVVRGHGPSRTATVSAVFSGDVQVKALTAFVMGSTPDRSVEGAG